MADLSKLVLEIDSNGVVTATGNLEKFHRTAEQAAGAANNAEAGVSSLDDVFKSLNLSSIASAAGVAGLVAAFGKAAGAAVDFGKQAVQTFSQFEQIENSLSGVLGSAEKGKEFFEDLRSFSFETTFGVDTLSQAASQLLNIGVASNKIKPSLKMIGDIAGGNTQKFNELTDIFAKIQNTGKATSVQLQQLALRGVPIYQVLKDMGVEGSASADDITRAFERMTAEFDEATGKAGVFYNNMQSINDTIQGREGFVSDTFREMLASFAEASGLAQLYKQALDVVYNALQNIVDWLAVINENPVYKAIFQGVLVGAVTALAVAIGGVLLSALQATIVKLGIIAALKAAINPASMAVGIGVAAAAFGGFALTLNELGKDQEKLVHSNNSLEESMKKIAPVSKDVASSLGITTNAMKEQIISIGDMEIKLQDLAAAYEMVDDKDFQKEKRKNKKAAKGKDSFLDADVQQKIGTYDLTEAEAQLMKLINMKAEYESAGMSSMWYEAGYEEQYQAQVKIVAELKKQKEVIDEINKAEELANKAHEERVRTVNEANQKYADGLALINSVYEQTDKGKEESRVNSIKAQIAQIEEMLTLREKELAVEKTGASTGTERVVNKGYGISDEERKKAEDALKYLNDQLNDTGKKTKENKQEFAEWQKVMQNLFSFSDTDVAKFLDSGVHGLEEYARRVEEEAKAVEPYWDLLNGSNKTDKEHNAELAKSQYENDAKMLQSLVTARDSKTGELIWSAEDKSIQNLKERVELEKEASMEASYQVELEALEKQGKQLGLNAKQLLVLEMEAKGYTNTLAEDYAAEKMTQEFDKQVLAIRDQRLEMGKTKQELSEMKHIAEGFTDEQAKELANLEAQLEKMQELAQGNYLSNKFSEMRSVAAESYNANGRQNLDVKEYAGGVAGQALMRGLQGSDAGNFIQGFQEGGIWGAVINTLVSALMNVCNSMEEFNQLINPITQWMEKLKPLLKALMDQGIMANEFIGTLLSLFQPLINGVAKVLNVVNSFFGGILSSFKSTIGITETLEQTQSEYDDELRRQLDHMKALNDQYKSLQNAIDEQEQYYLKKKMEVNAQAYDRALSSTQVNDMILTPKGNFSTDPNDYIIATKNPQGLGGGGGTVVQMNVRISNTVSDTATVKTTQSTNADGVPELLVMVSRKVAGDAASGANGWDDALNSRAQRLSGRRVMA